MQRLIAEIEAVRDKKFLLVTKDQGRPNGYVRHNKKQVHMVHGEFSVTAMPNKATIFDKKSVQTFLDQFSEDQESMFHVLPINTTLTDDFEPEPKKQLPAKSNRRTPATQSASAKQKEEKATSKKAAAKKK
jgi:hypothetical protein